MDMKAEDAQRLTEVARLARVRTDDETLSNLCQDALAWIALAISYIARQENFKRQAIGETR